MTLPDIQQLADSKSVISLVSLVGGGLLGNLIAVLRNRVKTLEYTVTHDRIGLSADDAVFGSIRVTWQHHEVTNLFSSTVTLDNQTTKDFANLNIKVYTGDTLLLAERTEIADSAYGLRWTDEFQKALHVEPGSQPTDAQFKTYHHSREYNIPVLNRGKRAVFRFLTTVPNATVAPSVWLDLLHTGVRVQFRPTLPRVHGVPVRVAASLGLIGCLVALVASSVFLTEPWAVGLVCLLVGLFAQSIGAFIYRALDLVKTLVVR